MKTRTAFPIRLYRAFVNILALPFHLLLAIPLALALALGRTGAIARRCQDERELAERLAGIRTRARHATDAFAADLDALAQMREVFVRRVSNEREARLAFELMTAHADALLRERLAQAGDGPGIADADHRKPQTAA